MPSQRRVLVVGGSFAGLCVARDMKNKFLVTIVDAKEYFEYTPGVLRAYVKPKHLDALTFTLKPVIEDSMGCKLIWGEVTKLDGPERTATIKPMFNQNEMVVDFDYCIIAAGCNFGPFHKWGESLWFPTIHNAARPEGSWSHIDERFLEGRRRHILEEYTKLKTLEQGEKSVLVVGAGFIGVEWVTELNHFFPKLKLTIIDFLPLPLGPLPPSAAKYCERYMKKHNINQFYEKKYDAKSEDFWKSIELPSRADQEYVCIGVKASNYFMPVDTLSEKGPGGGGWILMDQSLAVTTRSGDRWSVFGDYPRVFAVGDCNYGCVETPGKKPDEWAVPPIPKISYPGEEEAVIAVTNIEKIDALFYEKRTQHHCGSTIEIANMHWPWGAGMFATSLGPHDACFVIAANWKKGSGYKVLQGQLSAVQKEVIEASKINECRNGIVGRLIWHFVHHTPVHLFGGGPFWGY